MLSNSGISDYIEFYAGLSPSVSYTIDSCKVDTDIISFVFSDEEDIKRYRIYKTDDLTLIYDYYANIQFSSVAHSNYGNRFLITESIGRTEDVKIIFIGKNGVTELSTTQTYILYEANDTYDNQPM